MNKFEKRLQKLESLQGANSIKWVRVVQAEGQSLEDAIRLAGLPAYEENRGLIVRKFSKSFNEKNAEFLINGE